MRVLTSMFVICVTTMLTTAQVETPDGCGTDMGCFGNCDDPQNCKFVVTWSDNEESVDFTISMDTEGSSNQWIALGLSEDQTMGDDSVTNCISSGNSVTVYKQYNTGQSPPDSIDQQTGILSSGGQVNNGILTCSFTLSKSVIAEKVFDLTKDYYFLVAYGSGSGSGISKHVDPPITSSSQVDLQSNVNILGTAAINAMVKVHGCLMLFAWVFCASIGIVFARFYKPMWPNTKACSLDLWFVFHRICMMLACLCCIAAFIIIFVEVEEWSKLEGQSDFKKAHPYLGVLVTALCIINPIMAMFRPGKDDSSRPLFNWAHWGVGTVAHILSALTLIIGVTLSSSLVPDYVVWILLAWVVYQMAVVTLLEIFDCCVTEKKQRFYRNGDKKPPKGHILKNVMLAFHICIITGFTVATIIIVATGTGQ